MLYTAKACCGLATTYWWGNMPCLRPASWQVQLLEDIGLTELCALTSSVAQLPQQHPKTEPKWLPAAAEMRQRSASSRFMRSLVPPFLRKFPALMMHFIHVTPGEPPSAGSSLSQGLIQIAGEGNKGLKWFVTMRRRQCDSGGATGMTSLI